MSSFNFSFLIVDIVIQFPCSTKKNGTGEVNVTMRFTKKKALDNVTLALNVMKICGEASMSFPILKLNFNLSFFTKHFY